MVCGGVGIFRSGQPAPAGSRTRTDCAVFLEHGKTAESAQGKHGRAETPSIHGGFEINKGAVNLAASHHAGQSGLSAGDLEKLPSWQFFKTRSENAVSASFYFSSA
jgi:hypothetical protein